MEMTIEEFKIQRALGSPHNVELYWEHSRRHWTLCFGDTQFWVSDKFLKNFLGMSNRCRYYPLNIYSFCNIERLLDAIEKHFNDIPQISPPK